MTEQEVIALFKEHEIENLTTKWEKDGNSFVAKGYFVVKDTDKNIHSPLSSTLII